MFISSPILSIILIVFYLLGFLCAAFAVLRSRTPQGATAWIIGLITLPFFTVPLFLFFGRSKFYGYRTQKKWLDKKISKKFVQMQDSLIHDEVFDKDIHPLMQSLSHLCRPGFSSGNKIDLLIDGKETYSAMLKDIEEAKNYIIFQFYIFRADSTGLMFAEALMKKARAGIKINFLYDEIGTEIPDKLISEMREAGIHVCHFNSLGGKGRFQINFRNHRKILIVDGKCAFLGGLNIGDDYLGLWPKLGPWRDTHVRVSGPAVLSCQLTHAKDWYWCQQQDLEADWKIQPVEGEANVLIIPSGPADEKQSCLLAHIAMVNSAKERLWIANPYLVPPESLLDAIFLAALRGVDVRFILPSFSDAWAVMLASEVYVSRLLQHGVKVFRFEGGFLHQKVMLVDHLFAVVGSANLDFRSMFINFEITLVGQEEKFIESMEAMLLRDFKQCREISLSEYENVSLWKKITTRSANLLAPML